MSASPKAVTELLEAWGQGDEAARDELMSVAGIAGPTCAQPKVLCTDFGDVGRNVLRGLKQINVDFSIINPFPIAR